MKKIFVATDLSAASHNATLYAAALARQFGAKLFLFHAYQAPVHVPESYIVYTVVDVWASAKEELIKEHEIINPSHDLDIEICGDEGIPAKAILENAKRQHADLVICGMKQNIKGLRRIFGSTATALSRQTDIPLLVIPAGAIFKTPSHIALANDTDDETSGDTVALLKEMTKKFNARLSVVYVVDKGFDEVYKMRFRPAGFINSLKEENPSFEFPAGDSIGKTLDSFVNEYNIDMVAAIPHKHTWFERFLTESATKDMVFNTHVPLLILPQKKKGTAKAKAALADKDEDYIY